jgi:hypothetical protein
LHVTRFEIVDMSKGGGEDEPSERKRDRERRREREKERERGGEPNLTLSVTIWRFLPFALRLRFERAAN